MAKRSEEQQKQQEERGGEGVTEGTTAMDGGRMKVFFVMNFYTGGRR